MYWNYREDAFETSSHVLCREVYYAMSLFGRVHYQRFYGTFVVIFGSCEAAAVLGIHVLVFAPLLKEVTM